jgi:hypothetical protein
MDKIKLYSPVQVGIAAFCGGPLATVYTIWQNFRAMGNDISARRTLIWGTVIVIALLLVLPFLPDKFPNLAIPLANLAIAQAFVQKFQMTKQAILESEQYGFQSNWNVFGVIVAAIVAFLAILVALIFAFIAAGYIEA